MIAVLCTVRALADFLSAKQAHWCDKALGNFVCPINNKKCLTSYTAFWCFLGFNRHGEDVRSCQGTNVFRGM